jgi:uncharacterized protein (DUF934 family)
MRYILRQREWVPDEWRYSGEERAAGTPLIVPWAELRADPARWAEHARLGVRLSPTDAVEELAALLMRLELIAIEFPNAGDGRGYSQAHLLRERLHFKGELRAVGAGVRQDQVFFLARTGFDVLELAAGEDPQAAVRAYGRYDVAYQPGASQIALRRQRFYA